MLRRALAHRLGRGRPARRGHQRRVEPWAADERLRRPVRRFEEPEFALQPGQREHAVLLRAVANSSAASPSIWWPPYVMKLKTKPSLPSSSGNALHLLVAHAGRVPVERGREVVGQHLVRVHGVDRLRELAGVVEVRGLRLHPDQVGERRGRQRLGDRVLDPALDLVVALRRLGQLAVPADVDAHRRAAFSRASYTTRAGERAATPPASCPTRSPSPTRNSITSATAWPIRLQPRLRLPVRRRTGSRSRRAALGLAPAPPRRAIARSVVTREQPDAVQPRDRGVSRVGHREQEVAPHLSTPRSRALQNRQKPTL